ncbi:MAG TPA: plastocyanin/azurin family copper-binding protein, partial [Chloroflexota bacterium]|nr:plastocyanin/azurin family copper-binding protein [Chloroflexota bacterium]
VTMQNIRYQPQQLTVASGTTVQWVNQDNVAHTVTSGTPQNPTGQFDSGIMQQGQQYSLTFDQPGTYQYFCEVHPFQMQAVVQVTSGGTGGGQAGQQTR